MGKRKVSPPQLGAGLTEYEINRLKKLQFNASRMEAAGFKTLANNVLLPQYNINERRLVDDDVSEEEEVQEGYGASYIDEGEAQNKALWSDKNQTLKGARHSLAEKMTMAEFAKLRSQKRQKSKSSATKRLIDEDVLHGKEDRQNEVLSMINFSNPRPETPCGSSQVKDHQAIHQQQNMEIRSLRSNKKENQRLGKPQVQQRQKSKEMATSGAYLKNSQFCPPGSLAMYMTMRKRQHEQKKQEGMQHQENMHSESLFEEQSGNVLTNRNEDNVCVEHISEDDDQVVHIDKSVEVNGNGVDHEYQETNEDTIIPAKGQRKKRGPTTMIDVHRRKPDERELIILNANGQPIGPTRECVTKFSRFLGTLAKSPHLAPLNCASWIYMPTKEKIWKYVKERYIIAEEGKKWVLETTNALWRVHKSRFKKEHYNSFETDEERLAFRPKNIPVKQFEELLEYWDSDMSKEICDKNTKSCALRSDVHTMGPSSYALLRHELQQNDQNNQAPTQAKVYKESRKRDPKRVYKSNSEKTLQNIEAINVQESQHDKEAESNSLKDAYCEVVDNGHLRLYGRGATKSKLNKKSKVAAPSYICPPEFFQSIKENLIRELAPVLTSAVVSQIQAANPGIQLKVPEIFVASEDTPCARSCLFKDNENSDSESID